MRRTFHHSPWFWLGLALLVVLVRGLFIEVMDVDAAQYASIAMEMGQRGTWLQVLHRGSDYLDKPPLLFWTSAASMRLFGRYSWAYKLPSLLGALAGVYAIYRFSKLFYTEQTARHAALILASGFGLIVICNDVRTDTLLLGMTACAVWQLAEYVQVSRMKNLMLAATFVGLAMLAKGPIGLVMPAFAVGTHLLLRRDWRHLFHWPWLAALGVVALVLAPMGWGLCQQFDLHPEKVVNGRNGVSGLWFFFWEQSFGRITGGNVWKNDTSALYFLHVYLWAFLPWPLLLLAGLWQRIQTMIRQKFLLPTHEEAYSLGGFLFTFVALSCSQYKLPHYIFVTLPWASVLVARWLNQPHSNLSPSFSLPITGEIKGAGRWGRGGSTQRYWAVGQYLVLTVLGVASVAMAGFIFPTWNPFVWGPIMAVFGWLIFCIIRNPFPEDFANVLVQRSVLTLLGAAFALNFHFYPHLLPFQSSSAAAHWARQNGVPTASLAAYHRHGHALDFYSGQILPFLDTPEEVKKWTAASGPLWVYTDKYGYKQLRRAGLPCSPVASFFHFQVTLLRVAFLDPATRPLALEPIFLLKILPE